MQNWHFMVCKLLKDFDSLKLCDISMEISKKKKKKKATLDNKKNTSYYAAVC